VSWATIRPLVKEHLESVDGIGQVHDYVRHTRFWDEFFKRHVKGGRVNTWEFTRRSMQSAQDSLGGREAIGCQYRQTHQIEVIGRLALSEKVEGGTEIPFQDLVDNVVDAFRRDTLLGGRLLVPNPPNIQNIGHQSYGGVLVHQATITLAAVERVGAV
jgi:hypothetical protein